MTVSPGGATVTSSAPVGPGAHCRCHCTAGLPLYWVGRFAMLPLQLEGWVWKGAQYIHPLNHRHSNSLQMDRCASPPGTPASLHTFWVRNRSCIRLLMLWRADCGILRDQHSLCGTTWTQYHVHRCSRRCSIALGLSWRSPRLSAAADSLREGRGAAKHLPY